MVRRHVRRNGVTSSGFAEQETIGSVTLASSGAAASAGVAGSPYAITPSAATGGTFNASNYSITYNKRTLTVNPKALTVTADSGHSKSRARPIPRYLHSSGLV